MFYCQLGSGLRLKCWCHGKLDIFLADLPGSYRKILYFSLNQVSIRFYFQAFYIKAFLMTFLKKEV